MYDQLFGTEWDEITREQAMERAFALGVAAGVGTPHPEELDRVLSSFQGTYDRSLVELAYDEGRTKALDAAEEADGPEDVWDELVESTGAPVEAPVSAALPGAITKLTLTDPPGTGLPSSLDFPSMLRK